MKKGTETACVVYSKISMSTVRIATIIAAVAFTISGTWLLFSAGAAAPRASLLGVANLAVGGFRSPPSLFSLFHRGTLVTVGETTMRMRVARTQEEHAKGLSGIPALRKDEGMLYVYPLPHFYVHSMKDMLFPLDIIWIGKDKKIVDFITDVPPESYPEYSYVNDFLAQYVLEVNAGVFNDAILKLGDGVEFSFKDAPKKQ